MTDDFYAHLKDINLTAALHHTDLKQVESLDTFIRLYRRKYPVINQYLHRTVDDIERLELYKKGKYYSSPFDIDVRYMYRPGSLVNKATSSRPSDKERVQNMIMAEAMVLHYNGSLTREHLITAVLQLLQNIKIVHIKYPATQEFISGAELYDWIDRSISWISSQTADGPYAPPVFIRLMKPRPFVISTPDEFYAAVGDTERSFTYSQALESFMRRTGQTKRSFIKIIKRIGVTFDSRHPGVRTPYWMSLLTPSDWNLPTPKIIDIINMKKKPYEDLPSPAAVRKMKSRLNKAGRNPYESPECRVFDVSAGVNVCDMTDRQTAAAIQNDSSPIPEISPELMEKRSMFDNMMDKTADLFGKN